LCALQAIREKLEKLYTGGNLWELY
jgi:hypothetical protein